MLLIRLRMVCPWSACAARHQPRASKKASGARAATTSHEQGATTKKISLSLSTLQPKNNRYNTETMAKSIRSKSKRKNRTEFRNTIGTVSAYAPCRPGAPGVGSALRSCFVVSTAERVERDSVVGQSCVFSPTSRPSATSSRSRYLCV